MMDYNFYSALKEIDDTYAIMEHLQGNANRMAPTEDIFREQGRS